jgi:hypothetical protein
MSVRHRWAIRPQLERVESRRLLSGLMVTLAAQQPNVSAYSLLMAEHGQPQADASTGTGTSASGNGNTGGVGNSNGLTGNTNTPLLGAGTPTAQELKRETFRAGFSGRYYTGPGRFSDQGTTYYYRGLGGSSFFLHGDFDMAVVTPTNPADPFVGVAVLNDKSTNSSGIVGLDLTAVRTAVDKFGRPTQLTFQSDPNIYSGVFFASGSQGTVDIHYGSGPNHPVTVTFHGLIYTSGLTSPLVNMDLYARHGRPLRFR